MRALAPPGRKLRTRCPEQPVTTGGILGSGAGTEPAAHARPRCTGPADRAIAHTHMAHTRPCGQSPPDSTQALSWGQAQGGTDLHPPSFRAWASAVALLACGHRSF